MIETQHKSLNRNFIKKVIKNLKLVDFKNKIHSLLHSMMNILRKIKNIKNQEEVQI